MYADGWVVMSDCNVSLRTEIGNASLEVRSVSISDESCQTRRGRPGWAPLLAGVTQLTTSVRNVCASPSTVKLTVTVVPEGTSSESGTLTAPSSALLTCPSLPVRVTV